MACHHTQRETRALLGPNFGLDGFAQALDGVVHVAARHALAPAAAGDGRGFAKAVAGDGNAHALRQADAGQRGLLGLVQRPEALRGDVAFGGGEAGWGGRGLTFKA